MLQELFSLEDMVIVVTGGTGVLGGEMVRGLAGAGAKVGVLGRREEKAREIADGIGEAGGTAIPLRADVRNREQLEEAREEVLGRWGRLDVLVNAAGGNVPGATLDGAISQAPFASVRSVSTAVLVPSAAR